MRDQSDYLLPKGNATSKSGGHKMQLSPRLELIIASTLVLDCLDTNRTSNEAVPCWPVQHSRNETLNHPSQSVSDMIDTIADPLQLCTLTCCVRCMYPIRRAATLRWVQWVLLGWGKGAKKAIHCETYWLITTYIAGLHLQVSPRDSLSIHHHMQGERLSVLPRPLSVSLHHIEAPTYPNPSPRLTLMRLMSTPAGSLLGFSGHGQHR
ncbi:hypothetical protein NEUTE2DRAFT_103228 [Neurospora tetrasperma FGSC 2509]|nr:hypothetical protein NEUTE2DRAFT_103228 [Neurospora tetrasperma FGSC 2509]